jgi:hypothetical protein
MQRRKMVFGLIAAALIGPAFAADYGLRTECGRVAGSEYRSNRLVETFSALNTGRAGTGYDSTHFRLANYPEFTGYFFLNHNTFPQMAKVVYDARATKEPINICYRPTDFYVYGVELSAKSDGEPDALK